MTPEQKEKMLLLKAEQQQKNKDIKISEVKKQITDNIRSGFAF